ncbi:MAG: adenylate/guanylate cyclase domain-containing protein [Mycobacteriales bacterium]
MKLLEGFRDPSLYVQRVVVFFDIVGSTMMKERETQSAWLTNIASFYDIITEVVEAAGCGTIVKFLGDGAMIVYNDDHALQAINDAIKIQEAIKDDVQKRKVLLHASVGIATGEVAEFKMANGTVDCLGSVVDRASRLCSIASAGAIFVDTATTQAAPMHRVSSLIGSALDRKTDEYQGPTERASVPGFSLPIEYSELLWERQLFGVKSKVMTAAAESTTSVAQLRPGTFDASKNLASPERAHAIRGVVRYWDEMKHRGVISSEEEEFYCDERYTIDADDLESDDIVYFVPFGTASETHKRIAGAALYIGQTHTNGTIVHLSEKGFGFIRVEDSTGTTQDVFMSRDEGPSTLEKGDPVTFAVAETGRGARAEDIELTPGNSQLAA